MTVTMTIAQKTKTPLMKITTMSWIQTNLLVKIGRTWKGKQKKMTKSMKTKKGEVTDHHTKTDLTEEWQGAKYRETRQGHKMAIHQIRAGIILRRGINMEVVIQTSGKEIAALVGNITVHQSMLGDE